MANKDMKITIGADQVMYSTISKSKDGFNSARLVAKVNDNEYMSVSYEWEGKNIPDFAMNLMSFMQANELEIGTVVEQYADEYAEMAAKKGKKGVNPFAKNKDKDTEDEEDPKDKKKKKDDKKKKKEKSEEDKTLEDE